MHKRKDRNNHRAFLRGAVRGRGAGTVVGALPRRRDHCKAAAAARRMLFVGIQSAPVDLSRGRCRLQIRFTRDRWTIRCRPALPTDKPIFRTGAKRGTHPRLGAPLEWRATWVLSLYPPRLRAFLQERQFWGIQATIRKGPPLPPLIFIGRAMT
jgi:hypothetical protein